MQVVQIGYGKATFPDASATLTTFTVETPWVRQFPNAKYESVGKAQAFGVTEFPQISGNLMLASMSIPDRSVLCLQLSQKAKGLPLRDGAVWLSVREKGPSITIAGNLPIHHESLLGPRFLMFQGRADILSADEVEDAGYEPLRAWIDAFMFEEEVEECFMVSELGPEIESRPRTEVVTSLSGEKVKIQGVASRRRIRISKNSDS